MHHTKKKFNRQLSIRGTSVENVVGILTNGLKVPPTEDKNTGSDFGKGIYFSNTVLSSVQYCCPRYGVGLVFFGAKWQLESLSIT